MSYSARIRCGNITTSTQRAKNLISWIAAGLQNDPQLMNIVRDGSQIFTSATLSYRGQQITLQRILIDTGSESTAFRVDAVEPIGIRPQLDDQVQIVRGVGGREVVF